MTGATVVLGITLFFVLSLGGVMIYLFFRGPDEPVTAVEEKKD